MPQPFNNAVMTNAGAALLTRAQAGQIKIQFTRIATGNGSYTADEKTLARLQQATKLKSLKNSYPLSDIDVFSDGNYSSIVKEIKKRFKANEWLWVEDSSEMFEEDTELYHRTITFEKERSL